MSSSTMKRTNGNLTRSFGYAFRGIIDALTRERNLRIHFAAGAFALFFSGRYYALSRAETALLVLCVGFVVAAEMLNTAIEKSVDLTTAAIHPLAKTAKDVAAGAVLISAATSIAVGFLLFWDVAVLTRIWMDVIAHPVISVLVLGIAVIWVWWPGRKTDNMHRGRNSSLH
jgi:diacylglycerol kinase